MKLLILFALGQFGVSRAELQVDLCKPLEEYPDPTLIRSTWKLVFNEDFDGAAGSSVDLTRWNNKRVSPYGGGDRNAQFGGLDIIDPSRVYLDGSGWVVFDARETSEPYKDTSLNFWATGLLTTEWANTEHPFKVRTGDYIETVFVLPNEYGAWPSLWTWGAGNYGITDPWQEVDSFEYHPDSPHTLEFTSRIHNLEGDTKYVYNPLTIAPGKEALLGTHYGEHSITWYLNGCRANSTVWGQGVGPHFDAFIYLNLAISAGWSAGRHHPPIPEVHDMQFKADYVKVWRKDCDTNVV